MGPNERAAFARWLNESRCPEAVNYRRAWADFESARRGLAAHWKAAHNAFRELGRPGTGPSDGARGNRPPRYSRFHAPRP